MSEEAGGESAASSETPLKLLTLQPRRCGVCVCQAQSAACKHTHARSSSSGSAHVQPGRRGQTSLMEENISGRYPSRLRALTCLDVLIKKKAALALWSSSESVRAPSGAPLFGITGPQACSAAGAK